MGVANFSTCGTLNCVNAETDRSTLVDLLGETRAQVVGALRGRRMTVAVLARELELSEVAVRRHLVVLERDGLVETETVRRDRPGRPSTAYSLTERARRLFPDRNAEFANELLDYLEEEYGRRALLGFLRWRQSRQGERYAAALSRPDGSETAATDVAGRAEHLAALLTEDGFPSDIAEVAAGEGKTVLELRQNACAIADVAEAHPEVCAYEAALFQRLLGVNLSRRQTIAAGASACVCSIRPAEGTPHGLGRTLDDPDDRDDQDDR